MFFFKLIIYYNCEQIVNIVPFDIKFIVFCDFVRVENKGDNMYILHKNEYLKRLNFYIKFLKNCIDLFVYIWYNSKA